MKSFESILDEFYCLFNIPIKYLNNKLEEVLRKDCSQRHYYYYEKLNVFEKCTKNNSLYKEVDYNNIHFFIINCSYYTNLKGCIVIGPITTNKSLVEEYLIYKPKRCIEYIIYTIKSLLRYKFKMKNYNSHIYQAIEYIHKNYYKEISMDDLCGYLNLNKSYFCCLFKDETSMTFSSFLNKVRIEMSKIFLLNKNLSIMDVSLSVGYNNHNYFSTLFKKINNMTPLEFRNKMIKKNNQK